MASRIFVLVFLVTSTVAAETPEDNPAARPYWRTIVRGTHGMVAAEHPLEAMAGLEALQAGGNAMDAALAVFYMTAVVEHHLPLAQIAAGIPSLLARESRRLHRHLPELPS